MHEIVYTDNTNIRLFDGVMKPYGFRVFTPTKEIDRLEYAMRNYSTPTKVNYEVMILEGDWSDNIPFMFEGLASVGNGNGLKVESNNSNMWDVEEFLKMAKSYTYDNGEYFVTSDTRLFSIGYYPNVDGDITISCKAKLGTMTNFRIAIVYTDGTFANSEMCNSASEYMHLKVSSNPNKKVERVRFDWTTLGTFYIKDLQLICKNNYEGDVLRVEDEKPILLRNSEGQWVPLTELNGIDINNCDTIDSTLNKYTKKYVKYKFTGNESIQYVANYGDVSRFNVINLPIYSKGNSKILCNRFNVGSIGTQNLECVNSHHDIKNIAIFQIKTNRLDTATPDGFKKWLIANPTEIIVELENPLEYELAPLQVDAHEGDMLVQINSETVKAPFNFKVSSYLANIVKANREDIKRIHNEIFKSVVVRYDTMFKNMFNGNLDQVAYMLYPEEFEKHEAATLEEPII